MNDWRWRFGTGVFSAILPFVTVGLLLLMLHIISGTMTTAHGALFDLPQTCVADEAQTESVALIVPVQHETLVFFDDSRYIIGSEPSMRSLEDRMAERFLRSAEKTLLVLVDRRVSCGNLMEFAARVRRNGVSKVLFAEKSAEETSE